MLTFYERGLQKWFKMIDFKRFWTNFEERKNS